MTTRQITTEEISDLRTRLESHSIYEAIETMEDLRLFMEHHIYSVWDFMSLAKYLQSAIAPTRIPWMPMGDPSLRRFINEIVLEEESDETPTPGEHASHFELYRTAMEEIGANTQPSAEFLDSVGREGIAAALQSESIPLPSKEFMKTTFAFIEENRPHCVAAAFALGREQIVPVMFRSILERIGVAEADAPTFHFYLNRHIGLDEEVHGPLSMRLLNSLCDGDETKIEDSIEAAHLAVKARLEFWDGVLEAIEAERVAGIG